jgi:hypothetical protein
MISTLKMIMATMALAASCLAQDGLVIRTYGRQKRPAEAEKVYRSACSAIEREFRISRPLRPQVTLTVGSDQNGAYLDVKEIRLMKWDPYLFAQGVVFFAFEELLPEGERIAVAKRAVSWADSTISAKSFAK